MAFYVYDNQQSLPLSADIGDQAITREEKNIYVFSNISTFVSYSNYFQNDGHLLADSIFSTFLDSQDKTLTIDFWTNSVVGNFPVFIAEDKNVNYSAKNLVTENSLQSENIKSFIYSPTEDGSPSQYFTGSSYISAFSSEIDFNDSNQKAKEFYPFTLDFWTRKNNNKTDRNLVSFINDDRKAILRFNDDKIIFNDVEYTFTNSQISNTSWQHNALTYDGFDFEYYKDGQVQTLTRDPDYQFSEGTLSFGQINSKKDAAFQCKVKFSSSPSDGTLFELGSKDHFTRIAIVNGGTQLKFSCGYQEELEILTSSFPRDDQEHVVSWDIQINPARIRLWIDGKYLGQSDLTRSLTNFAWGAGEFAELDLSNNEITYKKEGRVYEAFFNNSARDFPGGVTRRIGDCAVLFSADVTFPASPQEGTLWINWYKDRPSTAYWGFSYVGIVRSGSNYKLKYSNASNSIVTTIETDEIPFDGQQHTVAWEFFCSPSFPHNTVMRLWIDDDLKGERVYNANRPLWWGEIFSSWRGLGAYGNAYNWPDYRFPTTVSYSLWPGELVNDIRFYRNAEKSSPIVSNTNDPESGLTPFALFPARIPSQHTFEDNNKNLVVDLNRIDSDGRSIYNIDPISKSTYVYPWGYTGASSGLSINFDNTRITNRGEKSYYFEFELELQSISSRISLILVPENVNEDTLTQYNQYLYYFPPAFLSPAGQTYGTAYAGGASMNPGERYSLLIDEASGTTSLFRNRTLISTRSDFSLLESPLTKPSQYVVDQGVSGFWTIGSLPGVSLNDALSAYVSDLKYSRGIAEYSSDFTPPTTALSASGASLLACRQGLTDDSSQEQRELSLVGTASASSFSPYEDSSANSVYFNRGSLTVSNDSDLTFTSINDPFTVQAWINPTTVSGGGAILSSSTSNSPYSASTGGFFMALSQYPGVVSSPGNYGYIVAGFYNPPEANVAGGAYRILAASKTNIPVNEWTHVAFVYDGTKSKLFINGVDDTFGYLGLHIRDEFPRPTANYGTSPDNFPENKTSVKFYFDPQSWRLNPGELRSQIGATVDGGFGQSPLNNDVWHDSIVSDLRYFQNTEFSSIEDCSMSIGAGYVDLTSVETGTSFAQNYIAETGGSIINHSTAGDLSSVISSMNDGDALVLSPGTYSIDPQFNTAPGSRYNAYQGIFLSKNILICGSTSDPNQVKILFGHAPASLNSGVFRPVFGYTNNSNAQIAFISVIRKSTNLSSYWNSLCYVNTGGYAYNVVFDFDRNAPKWSHNEPYVFSETTFEKCVFKNYGSSDTSTFAGSTGLFGNEIVLKNNVFERNSNFADVLNYSSHILSFLDSSRAISFPYTGYVSAFKVFDNIMHDSQFTPIYDFSTDSDPLVLVSSSGTGGQVLSYTTDGNLIVNNNARSVRSSHQLNTWTHTAISIDNNLIRVYEDGQLVTEDSTLIDSGFNLIPATLDIGRGTTLDASSAQNVSYYYDGFIKEFRINDNATDSPSYQLGIVDELFDESAGDVLLTATTSVIPDTNLVRKSTQGSITASLNSPYTASDFSWFKVGIGSQSPRVFFDSANNNDRLTNDRLMFFVDSYYTDSDRLPVSVTLRSIDDSNNAIAWRYDDFQNHFQIIEIGKDSSTVTYYLNPTNEGIDAYDRMAIINFFGEPEDSTYELFIYEGEQQSLRGTLEIDIMYDGMSTLIMNTNSIQGIKFVTINHVDSNFNFSGINFDSYEETVYVSVIDSAGVL